jgi:hypothetical protein
MAADNWAKCPRCVRIAERAKEAFQRRADNAYGNVSAQEYNDLLQRAQAPIDVPNDLREDYAIGIQEGWFSISYGANCKKCGFKYEHDLNVPVTVEV